jgi:aminomethyltransferase
MRRTPLYDEHVEAGARMVEFAGWDMPVQYRSIVDEHRAVRSGAGVFDVSHMGEVLIEGPEAERACGVLFANDARSLSAGEGQYSFIPNADGGVIDDVIVYRLGAESFLVCVNASNVDKDFEWLREHAPAGCRLSNDSDDYALVAVQGPAALGIVRDIIPDVSTRQRCLSPEPDTRAKTGVKSSSNRRLHRLCGALSWVQVPCRPG